MFFSNYFDIVPTIMGFKELEVFVKPIFQMFSNKISWMCQPMFISYVYIYMCVCVFHAFFSIEKLHVCGLYGM